MNAFENQLRRYFALSKVNDDLTIHCKSSMVLGQGAYLNPFKTTKPKRIRRKKYSDSRFELNLDYDSDVQAPLEEAIGRVVEWTDVTECFYATKDLQLDV